MTVDKSVIISNERELKVTYGELHFAPARRAGDFLFLSGVIAGPRPDEATDADGFKAQLRRAFDRIGQTLKTAGGDFSNVIEFTSYHVFSSMHFSGAKDEHLVAFRAVKDEYFKEPYPAWTAIGVEALAVDNGLVEIRCIAHMAKG